jgi:ribosome biogenesis GTPase
MARAQSQRSKEKRVEMENTDLRKLGFDGWFEERREALQAPGWQVARVAVVDRSTCVVMNAVGEVPAELAGKFMFNAGAAEDYPCVGDWVVGQYYDSGSQAIVHALFPRKSVRQRKTAGKKIEYQLIASNIDVAFIVQSCDHDFSVRRLDRYLAVVNEGGIKPVILLSKSDLVDAGTLAQRIADIEQAGITCSVLPFSNETGAGLDAVRAELEESRTYCLLGSSGVGKTTLFNALLGREAYGTAAVREKDGKGRHTTTRRQLTQLDNGAMMIDTPGMRELGMIGAGGGIEESFSDVTGLSVRCRFPDCTHQGEDGCAILAAIAKGELSEARFQSYVKLMKESEYHEMSYVEKRRKGKDLSRHIRSVMKHKKKRRDR